MQVVDIDLKSGDMVEILPNVYALPHTRLDIAYFLAEESTLIGVPFKSKELQRQVREMVGQVEHMILTERCEDSEGQLAWIDGFPNLRRIVHRMDAGRGKVRRDSDLLLSAGNDSLGRASLKLRPSDVGKERTRKLDDGPWTIPNNNHLIARWTPGPSIGACVIHCLDVDKPKKSGGILFTGCLVGFDKKKKQLSPFALEGDHSIPQHADSLDSLAALSTEFDFEWLLPARGLPLKFESPEEARRALRSAAQVARRFAPVS